MPHSPETYFEWDAIISKKIHLAEGLALLDKAFRSLSVLLNFTTATCRVRMVVRNSQRVSHKDGDGELLHTIDRSHVCGIIGFLFAT